MAALSNISRRPELDPEAALAHNRAEDLRLVQRVNSAAAELHRLWSAWIPDGLEGEKVRHRVSTLRAEIDRLYEQRRQLVAERALLSGSRRTGRRNPGPIAFPALAA